MTENYNNQFVYDVVAKQENATENGSSKMRSPSASASQGCADFCLMRTAEERVSSRQFSQLSRNSVDGPKFKSNIIQRYLSET